MADQILSLLVGKLVDYIAVPVGRLFSYLHRYDENLEDYRSQLRGLETRRDDVQFMVEAAKRKGEVILPGVEAWLKRVDTASDESKGFVEEEDAISKRCFNGPLNMKVRYQRSRKAKKKALEFDAIKKDGTFEPISTPPPPLKTWSVNDENEFDFESRRSIFNEIMEAVKDDGVEMIGIWGMPGIGKTTLVKRVGKYAQDEGPFEEVAMAVVSQNPIVKHIQGEIADHIGFKFTSESERGRASQLLQRLLAIKKVMVILDDIWDTPKLNDIGIPTGSQHKGCKIILTSRNGDTFEEMRTRKNFKIDLLSENEALNLFLRMSGVDDRHSEEGQLASNLCEECGCLPISIVIVAKIPKVYWEDTLNRLRSKSDPDKKLRACIELSYDKLYPEEEKMFFLLCALFPEDYKIPVQDLFEYGLGLGFFSKLKSVDEAEVSAKSVFSKLKSQCLLLDVGDKNYVKVHDVIRDVALAIATEGKHVSLVPENTAMILASDDVEKLPGGLHCPQLRILMMKCILRDSLNDNFFARMKNLIVLDLQRMNFLQLPQSLAALENLRTLRIINCSLGDISAIGKLQNLVSLNISYTKIKVLPKEVGELSNLRFFDLTCITIVKAITPGAIQNLSRLEVLRVGRRVLRSSAEQVIHPAEAILSECIHLPHLTSLEICIPEESMLPDDMQLFKSLTKFEVSIGKGELEKISSNSQILKLTNLSGNVLSKSGIKTLMKKARHLELEDISNISIALPSHLGGYGSLKKLIVNHCEDVSYIFDMTELEYELETPSLRVLHLINLPLLKEINNGNFPSLFVSKVEQLRLKELPSLVRLWPFQAQSYLTTMEVTSCDKLEYVFDHGNAKSLSKLKEFEVAKCRSLQAIFLSKEHDDVIVFPQLSQLKISELDNLTSFSSQFTSESTLFGEQVMFLALETLLINNLKKLEKIWHIHSPCKSYCQLKVLELTDCPELLVVFPFQATSALSNLEDIGIKNCDKLETLFQSLDVPVIGSDEMILFPRLLTLKLVNLPKFTAILSTTSQNIDQAMDQRLLTFFPKLKKLELEGIGSLSSSAADPLHIIKGLEALEELVIEDINAKTLPQVLANDKTLAQVIATLPKLRALQLGFIHDPIEWCESLNRRGGFRSLTSLHFFFCNGVKSLLRPSAFSHLVQLQDLIVEECETLEIIVGETKGEQNFDKVIEFSTLRTLTLKNLARLTSFYDRICNLKFPRLDSIFIKGCPKLKTFGSMAYETPEPSCPNLVAEAFFGPQVSFGRLRHLKLRQLESIEEIWGVEHLVTTVGELTSLNVKNCDRLSKLVPSNLLRCLQKLETLEVRSCRSLEHVFAVEDDPPMLSNLMELELLDLPKLNQLWWNKNSCESFGLSKLYYLKIDSCSALQFIFDPSVAHRLENLQMLKVENCSSMIEIVAEKPGKKIEFPFLYTLRLVNLPCFKVKQDVGFQPDMLFNMFVDRCFNMKNFFVYVKDELPGSLRYFESFVE